jgi:hypothetical protein
MNTAFDRLCDDLGTDLGGDDLRAAFSALAGEDDSNVRALVAAMQWIADQDRTPLEKLTAIAELRALPPGFVHIPSLREFCGFTDGDSNAERQSHN